MISYELSTVRSLAKEAQYILDTLHGPNVPECGLEYFTIGDSFRTQVTELAKKILELRRSPKYIVRVVLGPFGAGKSHFLKYLRLLLEASSTEQDNALIVTEIDLGRLNTAEEMQLHLVMGLKTAQERSYTRVLQRAYKNTKQRLLERLGGLTPNDAVNLYTAILYFILGQALLGFPIKEVLQALHQRDPVQRLADWFAGIGGSKRLETVLREARLQASEADRQFVDLYLRMLREPDIPASALEDLRALSAGRRLADIILRLLAWGDLSPVVILIDELETIKKRKELRRLLSDLRDLHESFSRVNLPLSSDILPNKYPAIALVVASTREFFDDTIAKEAPGLYGRWVDSRLELKELTIADIDGLIFRLRDLYYLAGRCIKPIRCDEHSHEVIELREKIREELKKPPTRMEQPYSTRRIIRHILKEIEARWVE